MKKITLPAVLVLMFCLALPVSASAYFTTSQSAVVLNENTVLFSITYSFGMNNSSLQMPIGARQNSKFNAEPTYLGYEFLSGDEPVKIVSSAALVLSSAKVENSEYIVKKGTAEKFLKLQRATLRKTLNLTKGHPSQLARKLRRVALCNLC